MAELKPCPFCGKPVTIVYNSFDNAYKFFHRAGFGEVDCFVQEPIVLDSCSSLKDAAEAWNRRAEDGNC